MTIYEYIKEYGKYSFEEKKFNEVDNVLFSFLSYGEYEKVLTKSSKMTIKEVAEKHIQTYKGKDRNIIATREAHKILKAMKDTKRYKDCIIFNYDYIGTQNIQFGVFSIEYQKNKVYVSFEGTDQLFSGWIENFMLSYEFPTISHKKAINYLNKHYTFSNKELIVGGHSKGGNLALVASMYANFIVKSKIKFICNADGPGLLDTQFHSSKYEDIGNKYIHIIPESSYVGLFLNHDHDKVIKTTSNGLLSHAINYWVVEDDHFEVTELNLMSKRLDKRLNEWISKYDDKEKYNFISNLDIILRKAEVDGVLELTNKKSKIFTLIHESKDLSIENKKVLKELLNLVISCFKSTKKEEIKDFISSKLKPTKNEVLNENIND